MWLVGLALGSFLYPPLGTIAIWFGYLLFAVIPDLLRSAPARRLADNVVNAADPGRGYREKLRNVELVGSVDSKRALAEECIRTARFGLLLENLGQQARAQALFAEIIKSVKGAPSYYRSRQKEWLAIAKSHLK